MCAVSAEVVREGCPRETVTCITVVRGVVRGPIALRARGVKESTDYEREGSREVWIISERGLCAGCARVVRGVSENRRGQGKYGYE